jgi:hypothetical protein
MHLKNGRNTGNGAYTQKETTFRVMVASRPKVSFRTDGSTSPGNYGWLFVIRTKGFTDCDLENVHVFK